MKALTIYQPWASAIISAQKRYETRSWATTYRGPIAIHAGKNADWCPPGHTLPLGAILGTGTLVECHRTGIIKPQLSPEEVALGDFSMGRYAWEIHDIIAFEVPIPARGQRNLWDWEQP